MTLENTSHISSTAKCLPCNIKIVLGITDYLTCTLQVGSMDIAIVQFACMLPSEVDSLHWRLSR